MYPGVNETLRQYLMCICTLIIMSTCYICVVYIPSSTFTTISVRFLSLIRSETPQDSFMLMSYVQYWLSIPFLLGMSASGEGAEYQETPPDYSLTQDINCTSESTGDSIPLERYYSPSMDSVTTTLRWGFYLHAYGFAFLFFFLAFYSFFSILNLR